MHRVWSDQFHTDYGKCPFKIKGGGTHEYRKQDACSKADAEPFYPGAVAESGGIQDLVGTMAGCHKTNVMSRRKSHRLPAEDLITQPTVNYRVELKTRAHGIILQFKGTVQHITQSNEQGKIETS